MWAVFLNSNKTNAFVLSSLVFFGQPLAVFSPQNVFSLIVFILRFVTKLRFPESSSISSRPFNASHNYKLFVRSSLPIFPVPMKMRILQTLSNQAEFVSFKYITLGGDFYWYVRGVRRSIFLKNPNVYRIKVFSDPQKYTHRFMVHENLRFYRIFGNCPAMFCEKLSLALTLSNFLISNPKNIQ